MRIALIATMFCVTAVAAAGQTHTATKKTATAPGRSECVVSVGLCVTVPATWQRLGNVFDDLGFVVAEPHPGTDAATWPQLNIAAIDVPAQKNGAAVSLDSLVERVLTPNGAANAPETLQRTRLLLNGANAQILRVKLRDEAQQAEIIEQVALIEGEDGLVYSIALRCTPQEFDRLDPIFQKVVHTWRIKPVTPPSATNPTPQDSKKK
jgi:hypothetical protein